MRCDGGIDHEEELSRVQAEEEAEAAAPAASQVDDAWMEGGGHLL